MLGITNFSIKSVSTTALALDHNRAYDVDGKKETRLTSNDLHRELDPSSNFSRRQS